MGLAWEPAGGVGLEAGEGAGLSPLLTFLEGNEGLVSSVLTGTLGAAFISPLKLRDINIP